MHLKVYKTVILRKVWYFDRNFAKGYQMHILKILKSLSSTRPRGKHYYAYEILQTFENLFCNFFNFWKPLKIKNLSVTLVINNFQILNVT